MAAPWINSVIGALSSLAQNGTVKVAQGPGPGGQYFDVGLVQLFQAANGHEVIAPLTGASVTILDQTTNYVINPAGIIAALTVTMPANPYDGQIINISATQTVTTLTHNANTGQTLNGALTTIGAAVTTFRAYVYDLASKTWFPTT